MLKSFFSRKTLDKILAFIAKTFSEENLDKIVAFFKKIFSAKNGKKIMSAIKDFVSTKTVIKILDLLKRLVYENPVLISGLSLGPVVAISQSLKAGVSLSSAFAIIILPVLIIFTLLKIKLSKSMRIILCTVISCIFFIPALWFAQNIFPEVSDKVGVFLPLMVVNPIITAHSGEAVREKSVVRSIIDAVWTTVGFSFVMCLVSALREILGKGTLWDVPIGSLEGNVSFLLPFTGFIIVGFLAAGARWLTPLLKKESKGAEK